MRTLGFGVRPSTTKRCTVCGRFRAYDADDRYCIICGHDALEAECSCGRDFSYALTESGPIHCPRCGKAFHGKSPEFEP
jgi:ribosomal protein L37E